MGCTRLTSSKLAILFDGRDGLLMKGLCEFSSCENTFDNVDDEDDDIGDVFTDGVDFDLLEVKLNGSD